MYLYLQATRDCPLSFDDSEVKRVDFGLPNSRKSDANLSIKVFGDLLEHPSPICARQQVATINCQFYGDKDECDSQEAMYAYQSLNKESSLLLCTSGVVKSSRFIDSFPVLFFQVSILGDAKELALSQLEEIKPSEEPLETYNLAFRVSDNDVCYLDVFEKDFELIKELFSFNGYIIEEVF